MMLKKQWAVIAVIITLIALFLFFRDKNKKDEKAAKINTITVSINRKQDKIISCKKTIDSLTRERESQYTYCNTFRDSVNHVVKESPMATAYINEFDKEPIEILQEYIKTATEEERDNLVKADVVLLAYAAFDFNQETIKTVRKQLQHFDGQMKICMNKIDALNHEIEKLKSSITILKEELSNLMNRREAIEKE